MTIPAVKPSSLDILQHPDWLAYSWLIHGFSTRAGGSSTAYGPCGELNLGFTATDDREAVRTNRDCFLAALLGKPPEESGVPRLATLSQVHSADIHVVGDTEIGSTGQPGDGLLTREDGVLLGILTADCVPVLVADTRLRVVGAFHAGWRGTVQRIVEKGIAKMVGSFGSRPADLQALIGPAIGPCCFTVGAEVRDRFRAEFDYHAQLMKHRPPAASATVQLDLRAANRGQLLAGGLSEHKIHVIGGCTCCEPERYFSHRQSGGNTGRMMSVIGVRGGKTRTSASSPS